MFAIDSFYQKIKFLSSEVNFIMLDCLYLSVYSFKQVSNYLMNESSSRYPENKILIIRLLSKFKIY